MHLVIDFSGPVFGPGLVQAPFMEEGTVVFPRIAIHEDAIERHRQDQTLWREGYSCADEERALNNLLRQDESGLHYVDYLRASLGETRRRMCRLGRVSGPAKTVGEEWPHRRFNATVRRKYSWLKNYHGAFIDENLANLEPGAMIEN